MIWHMIWPSIWHSMTVTFWRMLCRMCRHRPRSSCVSQPWHRTPGQRSVQVTLWMIMIEQYYIAATSSPHLAQRPLLLGVLGPVAKLPPSLAVTTPTCCWQPETWTWLFGRFHNFLSNIFPGIWYLDEIDTNDHLKWLWKHAKISFARPPQSKPVKVE